MHSHLPLHCLPDKAGATYVHPSPCGLRSTVLIYVVRLKCTDKEYLCRVCLGKRQRHRLCHSSQQSKAACVAGPGTLSIWKVSIFGKYLFSENIHFRKISIFGKYSFSENITFWKISIFGKYPLPTSEKSCPPSEHTCNSTAFVGTSSEF